MGLRKVSTIFKINGQPIPEPDFDLQTQFESLADENSGRTQDGVMRVNWIRRRIAKVNLKYSVLSTTEVSALLSLVQGQEFELTYIDPIEGVTTKHMYCSNADTVLHSRSMYGGLWRDIAFNCIEV